MGYWQFEETEEGEKGCPWRAEELLERCNCLDNTEGPLEFLVLC